MRQARAVGLREAGLQLQLPARFARGIRPVVRIDATLGRDVLVGRDREQRTGRVAHDPEPLDAVERVAEARRWPERPGR